MNFRYKLMQFMTGRYGMDKLSQALLITAIGMSVINIFLRFISYKATILVQLLVYAIVIYTFFRILSRNIEARRKENSKFLQLISIIKNKREISEKRRADTLHVYKKCPQCKAVLRLPHRFGVHKTICPRCNKEFTVKVKK